MLGRLGRDNAGNTLAIAAASLLPLMALIGGGVDISRSYMAKTELQSACDAGVLAGRKAMSKSGSYGKNEKAKADRMFHFNFQGDKLSVSNLSYETEDNDDGQVLGTATATVPTLVMKIFDKDSVDLSVNCMAELQIGNADVMFVLDNTHSMLCTPEDTKNPCTQLSETNTTTRFAGLKEAVKDFHRTINQSVNDTRTRIRYGFVPYAMTVNVSGLLSSGQMPTSYIADSNSYQTRLAVYDKEYVTAPWNANPATNLSDVVEEYSSTITQAQCGNAAGTSNSGNNYGVNKYPSSSGVNPVTTGGPAPTATIATTYQYESWVLKSGSGNSAKGTCKRRGKRKQTTYTGTTWYEFSRWIYQPDTISTSNYRNRSATTIATDVARSTTPGNTSRSLVEKTYDMVELAAASAASQVTGVTTTSNTWAGCIEERVSESPTSSYDFDPIPEDAYDLDLVTAPFDNATRWKPMWHGLYYDRSTNAAVTNWYKQADAKFYSNKNFTGNSLTPSTTKPTYYCPAPMALLDEKYATLSVDKTAIPGPLTTFLNSLVPAMYTYHDIGMIWGGRLLDPDGIFATNVNKDADKINVSKHLIFMTDGQLQPSAGDYAAWGVEDLDHRIAPSGSESTIYNRHMARFEAMCDAIKAQGTTIWVVSFASTMTQQLKDCASSGRSYYSSNTTALRNTFKFIASQVADLRLGA